MLETDQRPFGDVEFAENAEPRCPCLLLLDCSGSMAGAPIEQLNEGLAVFRKQLAEDRLAAKRVEVAIIRFGPVEVATNFCSAETFRPPLLEASGGTPLGEAIERGLDLLKERKAQYRESGIPYYRPWMFIITDGSPTDKWAKAARSIADAEGRKQIAAYAVGVEGADMDTLSELTVRAPLRLKGLAFGELFRWLSSSLSSVSRSNPGDGVVLENPAAPDGWAMIA